MEIINREEINQIPIVNLDLFEDLTGEIIVKEKAPEVEIGERIKRLRKEKALSLDELSKMTGFDVDMLAGIENNKLKPQIGTILKLSKSLDSAFGRIVSGHGSKLYSITRKDERKPIIRSTSKKGAKQIYSYKSLAPEVKGRHMEAMIVQLEENPDNDLSIHNGEEFIFVLTGIAQLKIGEDNFDLEPGDSAYYLSTTPHLISSKNGKATILAVVYE
ncbi:HTH domain-containing protein, Cro/C1-type [Candidatus Magnetomoraceae bacterium gMMP-15]